MADKDVILITGSSGFIAKAVIAKLAHRYEIVGLDRPGPPDPPEPAHAVDFDMASDTAVSDALAAVRARFGNRIASVIHLAAYYDVSGEPNPLYEEITVEGTRRLIEGLQSFEVGQFVFASTMLVHKPTERPDLRIDEDSPLEPAWAYPQSKMDTENLLHARRGDIPVVSLRIAGVYDDLTHSPFLAEQITRIFEHRLTAHLYPGMLCAAQAFVHVEDLADAVQRLVDRRAALPPDFSLLIGESEALGYQEIQNVIGQALHGEDWQTIRIPKLVAMAGAWLQNEAIGDGTFVKPWMIEASDAHYVLDTRRAARLLDWKPAHSLRRALPAMIDRLRANPPAWYKANDLNPALVASSGGTPAPGSHDRSDPTDPDRTEPHAQHAAEHQGDQGGGDHMAMMARDERRARWAHYANIGLGFWLAASPFVYDGTTSASVSGAIRAVTDARGLPPVEWRMDALMASDMASGLAIALFGALSLSKRHAWWAQWAVTFTGLWLFFAPLVFWSPSAAQYLNDMIVGALVISFSVLVPMMPGMKMAGMMDPKVIPPGWTYCPSTGAQRLPIAVFGLIGLLISRVLTAYQLGHIGYVWEPFFSGAAGDPRNGTEEIITSSVSMAWPIPDAGLGAIAYLIEILMAVMGGRDRWRTMPWMVTFFGILVVPLGVISIYFIIIQPIMIGTWSTLALMAALAMLVMIPFALDEIIAMGQFLAWARCRGKPLIRTFFRGDAVDMGAEDHSDTLATPALAWADAKRGVTFPWTLGACVAVGVLLMLTRPIAGTQGAMANSDHVSGALIITIAIIATAEVARPLRFLNVALGAWLIAAPFLLAGATLAGGALSLVAGMLVIGLSLPRGRRSVEHYAGWDRFVL
ncbi:NAD-dependent epimerase/dehydratase family protein [Sphingomonas koreensis]|uniref:NAD-dependent epimerase/dehydratase family protein n=1 Tax=Sphingomonas koreensis TaxID=93064 RepID=UPI00082D6182|nr:NAD-dependent epimerase/dehydratase family protein [Sphingomonas koreensis]PJI87222.1 nucleoside-diphosphate-sugar epimerase [Sphingomonas koreensis]RSU59566.1 NAD-dependent epimerase/dehydratase family protein [Sphingomonas koreensis]RSU68719.1 NAD-dependent epimerase/dehydratase family protein [Sphingomonas koreensis]